MEIVKLLLNTVFLSMVFFILIYNWLYAVRIKTSSVKIGMQTPQIINSLILLSILIAIAAIIFIGIAVATSVMNLSSYNFLAFVNNY